MERDDISHRDKARRHLHDRKGSDCSADLLDLHQFI
jgi:hypothetical protein